MDVEFVQENGPEDRRREADHLCRTRQARAAGRAAGLLDLGHNSLAFTETLSGRARCLVGHPVNPPHLCAGRIVRRAWTRPRRSTGRAKIYREIGQVPVTINREINGFALNRLQGALLAEAFRLVGEGYISAEDLDHTVKDGLGLRWSFLGRSRPSNSMRLAVSRIIAPATLASTRNWLQLRPVLTSTKARMWTG